MPDQETSTEKTAAPVTFTIQGREYTAVPPYVAGHVLNENEANTINQTWIENVRNNFAGGDLRKLKLRVAETNQWFKGEGEDRKPDWERVTNDDLDAEELETLFAKYVENYEFGARRAGGTRTPSDPVEAEARRIAKEALRPLLAAQNYKISEITADQWRDLIDQALNAKPEIRELARERVAATKGLDLSSLKI